MPFIVFEGLDGSGKSTLISGLKTHLEQVKKPVLVTHEPGGTPLAEKIRSLLLEQNDQEVPAPLTELFLYEASRAQHVSQVIRPAIEKNQWVLCDRYTASTLAFQAGARGLDEKTVKELNHLAVGDCLPDLWVLLDLPAKESMTRLKSRGSQSMNRIDQEKKEFHEKVRQHFLAQAKSSTDGEWLILNAMDSPESLQEQLVKHLREKSWLG